MKIPKPNDLGLPEKFSAWRANQEKMIDVMITSQRRVVALSAPTGSGKSPAYVAGAILSGKPTCFITNSKGLQDQLLNDFSEIGMVDIRGRSNYPCSMRDDYTCQEGYTASCPYRNSTACPYGKAEIRACTARFVVTNYDKWIASRLHPTSWVKRFEQIVLDEGHDAPDAVTSAMQFTISFDDVDKVLKVNYPASVESYPCWKVWAVRAREVAVDISEEWKHRLGEESSLKPSWLKQYSHLQKLVRNLSILATGHPQNWVVEQNDKGFQFDPIRPGRYAESTLFLHIPKIVIVSATLRPKTMYMLGLSKMAYQFEEFDSEFDRARCPVYYVPTMRIDAKAKDLSQLWVKLDQIMSRRQDRKGIVHTISYARQDEVMRASRFRGKMLANIRGESILGVLERFRESAPGTILVSPSVSTGYDFPGKDCEWQIICKIPFPDGRSKIIQARQADDKEYGPYSAMQEMVQSFGRGMRSKEDRCEGFIMDMHLDWFLPRYAHLAPKSFHRQFKRVVNVPAPLEAL